MESKILTNIADCVSIAVIHTTSISVKLWVRLANLHFSALHKIVNWLNKPTIPGNCGFPMANPPIEPVVDFVP